VICGAGVAESESICAERRNDSAIPPPVGQKAPAQPRLSPLSAKRRVFAQPRSEEEDAMLSSRLVAGAIVLSLVVGAVPTSASAEEQPGHRAVSLRTSVDAAATRLARENAPAARPAALRTGAGAGQAMGGGGGGKGMMIMTLVTTVVGVGAAYYMVKQL